MATFDAITNGVEAGQAALSARGRRRLALGRLGWIGAIILVAITAACVLTIPYTFGADARTSSATGGQTVRRYAATELDAVLLPPSWAPLREGEQRRLDKYLAKLKAKDEGSIAAGTASQGAPYFVLGTDKLGRDFFVRCLAGGGISLGIGFAAATISVLIGTLWGMIAGYVGGRTDAIMMRIVDVLYGLPYVLLVVLLAVAVDGLIGRIEAGVIADEAAATAAGESFAAPGWFRFAQSHQSLINVVTLLVAIGGVSWLTMARVIRGQVLSLRSQPFMEACRAIGVPTWRQLVVHLLPNLMGPIIVYATLTVPQAILQESFLSFLGVGIQAPLPSWGNLAAEGLTQLNPVDSRWWLLLWPCVLLAVTLLALNFLGEGLREAMDPRRRSGRGE